MNSARSFLGRALALSLVLHATVISVGTQLVAPNRKSVRPTQADLTVFLREQPVASNAPAPPQLLLPKAASRNANAAMPAVPRADSPLRLHGDAALRAAEQLRRELPYPPEAVERGLQGEALVLLFLDRSGNAIAARLETSSGHALLDDAALRAARSLRSLPDSAPREALLPVRFRLR